MYEETGIATRARTSQEVLGGYLRRLREERGLTRAQLATRLHLTVQEITQMEQGESLQPEITQQTLKVLDNNRAFIGEDVLKVHGGRPLHGAIDVNTSKNGAMGLLCASLLNRGKTVLHRIPRIEEVHRMLEVFTSVGVQCRWLNNGRNTLELIPPIDGYRLENINRDSASKTRSILMTIGAFIHHVDKMSIPHASGCNLGTRTIRDHIDGLGAFGVKFADEKDPMHDDEFKLSFRVTCKDLQPNFYVFTEQGDTSTENVLIAAAGIPGVSTLYGVSSNYMVREVCQFLQRMGVKIEGVGTSTLVVHGKENIDIEGLEYTNSEDPIEAMTLLTMGIVTKSELTVRRVPQDFIRFELNMLEKMKQRFDVGPAYKSFNGLTDLVDVTLYPSDLQATDVEIKPKTYPGINPDSAPFFVLIATQAQGETTYNDWMFDGRNRHLLKLREFGADIHTVSDRILRIVGKTQLRSAMVTAPPALRPSMIQLLAAMSAEGITVIRDTYQIRRGYQDFFVRANRIGAHIEHNGVLCA